MEIVERIRSLYVAAFKWRFYHGIFQPMRIGWRVLQYIQCICFMFSVFVTGCWTQGFMNAHSVTALCLQFVSLLIQSKLQIPGHLKSSPCTSLTKFFVYLLIFSFFFLVCVWSFCVSVYGTGDWNHEHHTERYVPAPGRFYLIVQAGYELESLLPESCRILV